MLRLSTINPCELDIRIIIISMSLCYHLTTAIGMVSFQSNITNIQYDSIRSNIIFIDLILSSGEYILYKKHPDIISSLGLIYISSFTA